MQSEMDFPSSHQLKSYVASKSRLKLAARAVLSADAGLLVITANMQSETGFPSRPSHQLKSYVASRSRLKLAARAVLSADAGLLVELFVDRPVRTDFGVTLYRDWIRLCSYLLLLPA